MEKAAFDARLVNDNNHIEESDAGLVLRYEASNEHSQHMHSFLALRGTYCTKTSDMDQLPPKIACNNLRVQRKIRMVLTLTKRVSIAVNVLQAV